jgi:uncharacterized protein YndB with AHSA1/START domain
VKEVFSEVEIQAPAERIWQVLTDFASYPEWNLFVPDLFSEKYFQLSLFLFSHMDWIWTLDLGLSK